MLWSNEGHFKDCRASRRLDQQFYRVCPPRHGAYYVRSSWGRGEAKWRSERRWED